MRAYRAVRQNYNPTAELLQLFENFRLMVNECTRIGIENGSSSLHSLSQLSYNRLSSYDVMSYYKLCAISSACGMLKNYHKAVRKNPEIMKPFARRLMLTTCYGFKIENSVLKLPLGDKRYANIALNNHTKEVLSNHTHTIRSICLTARTVSVTYAKEVSEINPAGYIGIDRNLNNVTMTDIVGRAERLDLSRITKIKGRYRELISHFKRNDVRVRRRICRRYGSKQRERVQQILHHASKMIVQQAKDNQYGIVMEKLVGMRRLYRQGNGQGPNYRFRLNSWSYAELQRQIEYKARWEGLPVIYVNPAGTSAKCSVCGSRMMRIPEENRQLKCTRCGFTADRDVNAARNILARALRFRAVGPATEAMVQEPAGAVILKVDAGQLTEERPLAG